MDCQRPISASSPALFPTRLEALFFDDKYAFFEECFEPAIAACSSASETSYAEILALDTKIRNHPYPPVLLQDVDADDGDMGLDVDPNYMPPAPRLALLRVFVSHCISTLLMHLHRNFHRRLLNAKGSVLFQPHFPSLVATFRSACTIIRSVDALYRRQPELAARFSFLWFNVFRGSAALFIIIERVPFCPLSLYSLRELVRASELFDALSPKCHMTQRASPIIREFVTKGAEALRKWRDSQSSLTYPDGFTDGWAEVVSDRLMAIIARIERGKPEQGGPSFMSPELVDRFSDLMPAIVSASNGVLDGEYGLDVWDSVHPELREVVRKIPGVLTAPDTAESLLWDARATSTSTSTAAAPESAAPTASSLSAFFDTLDRELSRRPTPPAENTGSAVADALRDVFPGDGADWAALSDALFSAPYEALGACAGAEWSGAWQWPAGVVLPSIDGVYSGELLADATSHLP